MGKKLKPGRKFVFAALLVIVASGGKTAAFAQARPTQQQLYAMLTAELKNLAAEINATTPTLLGTEVRLDRVTAGPGTIITYHSTLVNFTSSDVNSARTKGMVEPGMKESICGDENLKAVLQYGAILQYKFQSNDGVPISSLKYDRTDCGYPAKTL